MKLLIILAVLTLARGTKLEESDDILKELESLVDGKVAKENDDSELEELIKAIEVSDEPKPLSDEEFEKQILELEEDDPTKSLEKRKKLINGDAECHDKYGKCYKYEKKCAVGRYQRLLKRRCQYTCQFCFPAKCQDSKYGCCRKGSNKRADGRGLKGCPRKLCYDVQPVNCKRLAKEGACEGIGRKQMEARCPLSCKVCTPKQAAQPKCEDLGWGCCDIDTSKSALEAKRGCDDTKIVVEGNVPKPTCKDLGYGCCRSDGSKSAKGPKRGCIPCADRFKTLCQRMAKNPKKDCFSGPTTTFTLKKLCPRRCGYCKRT